MHRPSFVSLPILALALIPGVPSAQPSPRPLRWTDSTPDEMVDDAVARAVPNPRSEPDQLAAVTTIYTLAPRALWGHARRALESIASASSTSPDLAETWRSSRAR